MPKLINRWMFAAAVALVSLFGAAGPILAQDTPAAPAAAADGPKKMSMFDQFFWADDTMGLIFIWMLVLMSVVNVALVIMFFMKINKQNFMPEEMAAEYEIALEEKRYREAIERSAEDDSEYGQVVHAALSEASAGWAHMQRALEEQGDIASAKQHRKIEILNIFGATGPMIGLFGTVYGMIVAFSKIVETGGTPDPGKLAGGISTALVTTFWGLVVGIPAVAAASILKNKIDEIMVEVMMTGEDLIKQFKPKKEKNKDKDKAQRPSGPPPAMPKPRPV